MDDLKNGALYIGTIPSVSYTHLDVYKRQKVRESEFEKTASRKIKRS